MNRLKQLVRRYRWARRAVVALFFPVWLMVDVGGFAIESIRAYFRDFW